MSLEQERVGSVNIAQLAFLRGKALEGRGGGVELDARGWGRWSEMPRREEGRV